MKNYTAHFTATATLALLSAVPVCAGNLTILPARQLTPIEVSQFPNTPGIVTMPVTFKTAASVNTLYLGQAQPASVARGNASDAAVYSGFDGVNGVPLAQPAQVAPPLPNLNQEYEFKKSGDAVQAWATMTASGVPYIQVKGFGQFFAEGHASWRTTLPLPNGPHRIYLKVTVPSTTVFGNYDSNGPGRYHVRAHADVLVNGHSVYFGEAIRYNDTDPLPAPSSPCTFAGVTEHAEHLRTFGSGLGFGGNSDGQIDTQEPASTMQTVMLLLGSFDSTESVDVQFVLNAEASIENKCCHRAADPINGIKAEIFCSAASAGFDYQAGAPPVFYVQ